MPIPIKLDDLLFIALGGVAVGISFGFYVASRCDGKPGTFYAMICLTWLAVTIFKIYTIAP